MAERTRAYAPDQPLKQRRQARKGIPALAADLLFPPICPICRKILPGGRLIHPECAKNLPFIEGPVCLCCGVPLEDERREYCSSCEEMGRRFDRGKSIFLYEKGFRESVLQMKFHNKREFIPFYARAMALAGRSFLEERKPDFLLPIPMHKKKRRARGFDQCALLVRALAAQTGIPARRDLLVRVRETQPQKGLSAGERRKNMKNAFAAAAPLPRGCALMLIDDIYTTGSTMDEAAACLLEAGAGRVDFLALCTERKGPR